MKNKSVPLELIQQLRTWIHSNATRRETNTSAVDLRLVNETIHNLQKMSVEIPDELKRKRSELEIAVNTPSDDEQFLNDIAEQLSSLARDIKRRIGGTSGGAKAPAKILRVTLPDGRVICEHKAIDTFIETLRFMGLEKCARITVVRHLRYPVVSTIPNSYEGLRPGYIKEVDGYFIETKTSTDRKAEQLRQYAQELGIKIKVESIDQQEG